QVLPKKDYAPINSVKSLPDVNDNTPGAASIFKLYNAGIVSGIDAYGTFAPNNTISRAQMAAILCRLVQPESRLVFTLQPKPADLTVRSSSKALVVNGHPFYGLVDVGGETYLPLALGDGNDAAMNDFIYYSGTDSRNSVDLDFIDFIDLDVYDLPSVLPDYCLTPSSGNVIGTAQPGPTVRIPSEYHKSYNKIPTLALSGRFPMVKVSDLFQGCTVSDQGSAIHVEIPLDSRRTLPDVKKEPDLVGQALTGLLRSTPRETVRAIHDYLVNTLTYNPFNAVSEAAYEKASEQYGLEYNRILACKYGVCQDYTELFQEMCLRAGIPCEFVSGFAGGDGPHAWNRVYVDGKWLHVDCTWDDPAGNKPSLRYTYYLIEAETMAKNRVWPQSDYPLPAEYDPAWEQLDPNNITSADMFRKCLLAQVMQGKTFIRLKTTQSGAYGGIFCIYAYDTGFPYVSGGYNAKTKCYEYTIQY
ncbi:MAG: S-layer homology domain-containing protein, partial [Dysosmobacter sp.]|nr:S-layer homology domain-containing protein [Dysosmobacter sp.]